MEGVQGRGNSPALGARKQGEGRGHREKGRGIKREKERERGVGERERDREERERPTNTLFKDMFPIIQLLSTRLPLLPIVTGS